MEDKIRNLINKLQAVIDDTPYVGEKENAQNLLNKILKENGLTEADIIREETKWCYFKRLNTLKEKLLGQIIARYYSEKKQSKDLYRNKNTGKPCIQCTTIEFVEINARFEFFEKMFDQDLEIFFIAFIQKNDLGKLPINEQEEKEFEDRTMSSKDLKVAQMMGGIDKHSFAKQIEHKDE